MGQPVSTNGRSQHTGLPPFSKEPSLPAAVFHLYQNLPFELKLIIWEHAFEHRRVRIWGQWIPNYLPHSADAPTSRYVIRSSACNPPALSVNSETRAIALRFYQPIQFRCRLSQSDKLALQRSRKPNAASWQYSLWDLSLVSDSLAFINANVGDIMDIDLVNDSAYHARVFPESIALDFSFPETFQLLRLKRRRRHHTDRVVTSVLWHALRFRWHVVGYLVVPFVGLERILRINCREDCHDFNEVVPKTDAILCRLCGKRLAWALQV